MLLLADERLASRRSVAGRELRPLADSLAADLVPLLDHPPLIPTEKALLSTVGGRCETDGSDLEFDPFLPHAHRCPRCGRVHVGEWHDRWWLYPYQLWLAERAVHAATLFALRGDARHAELARTILRGYADRYLSYPNRDNVLGPSRVFFSTYLESLWLLHITIAADLVEHTGDDDTADTVRARICEPAVALIAQYNEGMSNRQVWNNAAIVATRTFLGAADSMAVGEALEDTELLLANAVGVDGTWYEGDNYHQFAHRGLWYAVTLGERLGYEFQAVSLARFQAGFVAPFLTALPDFTYPARKDSRYAASLRQWRFAESCELGLARADDPVQRWALARMYADDGPEGDTGRARSTGEAERHSAPVRLSRADLGWRSLLFAAPVRSTEPGTPPGTLTVESQGYTMHRRERGDVYVALDWGESGGGHGHPDRLNLVFAHGNARWLDDLGTGSYVDPSLHWYRSTLAHNAPLVGGASQAPVSGERLAAGAAHDFDLIAARVDDIAPGVRVDRTVISHDAYFVDEVAWSAEESVRFELPIHFDAEPEGLTLVPTPFNGGVGLEDGFSFVREARSTTVRAGTVVRLFCVKGNRRASAAVWSDRDVQWFAARAPGQPSNEMRGFQVMRCEGRQGAIRAVWAWRDNVNCEFTPSGVTVERGGITHVHMPGPDAWVVSTPGSGPLRFDRRPAETRPFAPPPGPSRERARRARFAALLPADPIEVRVRPHDDRWFGELDRRSRGEWAVFELGEEHYRRTEDTWDEAGAPHARVAVGVEADGIVVDVAVATSEPIFVPAGTANPLDNEQADINGHGVQVYFADAEASGGWVVVPEPRRSRAGVRRVPGWGEGAPPAADWRVVPAGFELRVRIPFRATGSPREFALNVIVNDAAPGRSRRRGQLVMSGAGGEFAYLRGDRHDPSRLMAFVAE